MVAKIIREITTAISAFFTTIFLIVFVGLFCMLSFAFLAGDVRGLFYTFGVLSQFFKYIISFF